MDPAIPVILKLDNGCGNCHIIVIVVLAWLIEMYSFLKCFQSFRILSKCIPFLVLFFSGEIYSKFFA